MTRLPPSPFLETAATAPTIPPGYVLVRKELLESLHDEILKIKRAREGNAELCWLRRDA